MQPCTPNCQQLLKASMFALRGATSSFGLGVTAFLALSPEIDPVAYVERIVYSSGVRSRDDLRKIRGIPKGRWIVVDRPPPQKQEGKIDPLICAVLLGLSGPTFYSPERPIVWTKERLLRHITLYKLGGFYED